MKHTLLSLFSKEESPQKNLLGFTLMVLCSQLIYAIRALKDVAFAQLGEMWAISATQLGALFSLSFLAGIASCFCNVMYSRYVSKKAVDKF